MRRENAFTLMELLVVIAVIAVLMSMLIPAVNSTRDQVKAVVCRSNLRQIGIAADAMTPQMWRPR